MPNTSSTRDFTRTTPPSGLCNSTARNGNGSRPTNEPERRQRHRAEQRDEGNLAEIGRIAFLHADILTKAEHNRNHNVVRLCNDLEDLKDFKDKTCD